MKIRTSDLTGVALSWAVACCEPEWVLQVYFSDDGEPLYLEEAPDGLEEYTPHSSWEQAGPIIEREGIDIYQSGVWVSEIDGKYTVEGPTPQIAAMRAYVLSKLGEEIEVPAVLLDTNPDVM